LISASALEAAESPDFPGPEAQLTNGRSATMKVWLAHPA
jgi:hypothetical protein